MSITSGLPQKADIFRARRHFAFVPKTDINRRDCDDRFVPTSDIVRLRPYRASSRPLNRDVASEAVIFPSGGPLPILKFNRPSSAMALHNCVSEKA
jgi:hypothetical protein